MELLLREKAETNPDFGKSPAARSIEDYIKNGLVILDKPAGPTSHQASAWVRDIFKSIGVTKAGHTGTLDPHVTGVLPVLIQDAVKIAAALAGAQKEYVGLMRLHKDVEEEKIRAAAAQFIGRLTQVPPKKAAVKKVARVREVYFLELLEIRGRDVLFRIGTEAGFYVRKMCEDFGKTLGIEAHMQQLRRVKAGAFDERRAVTLQDIRDAFEFWREDNDEKYLRKTILPMEAGLQGLKKILIKDSAVGAVCYGAPLHVGGVSMVSREIKENDVIALMSLKGELVALATAKLDSDAMLKKRAGVGAEILRVTMPRDVYPKVWGRTGDDGKIR